MLSTYPYCAVAKTKLPCILCGCTTSKTSRMATSDERICLDPHGCVKRMKKVKRWAGET